MKTFINFVFMFFACVVMESCSESVKDAASVVEQQKAVVLDRFELFKDYAKAHSRGLDYILQKSKQVPTTDAQKVRTENFVMESVSEFIQVEQGSNVKLSTEEKQLAIQYYKTLSIGTSGETRSESVELMPGNIDDAISCSNIEQYNQKLDNMIESSGFASQKQLAISKKLYSIEACSTQDLNSKVEVLITSDGFLSLTKDEQDALLLGASVFIDSYEYWSKHLNEWETVPTVVTRGWWNTVLHLATADGKGAFWGGIGGFVGGAIAGSIVPGAGTAAGATSGYISGSIGGAVVASAQAARLCYSTLYGSDACTSDSGNNDDSACIAVDKTN